MYGRTEKSVLRNIFWLFLLSNIIVSVLRKDKAFAKCGLIGGENLFYKMHILYFMKCIFCCCYCSLAQSCLTICDPMSGSMPDFPIFHYHPEFAQTHVHWVSDVIQPSHPLLHASPLALNLSQIQSFPIIWLFNQVAREYWSFSYRISPSNEYSGLISFRIDWFDFLAVQETLKNHTTVWKHQFFGAQASYGPVLTSIHDYWKSYSFDHMELCQQNDGSAF